MADLVGKVLANRYRVDNFIGKGGMAEVYKVWDLERAVFLAMKVLYSDLAEDKIFLRRFAREAETLSSLQHPYIVRFYGMERDSGLSFMLMDYVEGTTLRKQIFDARKPFSPQQILQIMRPVCSALHYAHEMGRVHCDIKPANIMVAANGDVLVADFGIARMMESGTTMTMVGAGTPAYMAPEQVLGKKPSPQTDIYSLGIVLYEMLTAGERPFTGEQAEIDGTTSEKVRWEQAKLPPPSPRQYNPAISRDLEKVILNCLKKNPAQRYASTLELLQALELALGGEKVTVDFATKEAQIRQSVDEVRPLQQKEIPKEPSSKAIMIGIASVAGVCIIFGIGLMVMFGPRFLGSPIYQPTTTIPTHVASSTNNPPTLTETAVQPTSTHKPTVVPDTATSTVLPETSTPIPRRFYTEEFDVYPSNWSHFLTLGVENNLNLRPENGKMIFEINGEDTSAYLVNNSFNYTDVQEEAVVLNRGVNDIKVGLICRYSDSGWYEVQIANTGLFEIYAMDKIGATNKGFNRLYNGGSQQVKPGVDTNVYKFVCRSPIEKNKGPVLAFYVNGRRTQEYTDNQYKLPEGNIGISVSSLKSLPVIVQFESLKISEPETTP
jgi:serine/threonine protein kinase